MVVLTLCPAQVAVMLAVPPTVPVGVITRPSPRRWPESRRDRSSRRPRPAGLLRSRCTEPARPTDLVTSTTSSAGVIARRAPSTGEEPSPPPRRGPESDAFPSCWVVESCPPSGGVKPCEPALEWLVVLPQAAAALAATTARSRAAPRRRPLVMAHSTRSMAGATPPGAGIAHKETTTPPRLRPARGTLCRARRDTVDSQSRWTMGRSAPSMYALASIVTFLCAEIIITDAGTTSSKPGTPDSGGGSSPTPRPRTTLRSTRPRTRAPTLPCSPPTGA